MSPLHLDLVVEGISVVVLAVDEGVKLLEMELRPMEPILKRFLLTNSSLLEGKEVPTLS